MVELFLYKLANGIGWLLFSPFIWLFSMSGVPMSICFSLTLLSCAALLMARWKFGAHKWLGTPIVKITKYAVPFLFILSIYIAGYIKEGDIAKTDDQGAHVQLSGEFIITGVLDQSLGGFNISLTPVDVMEDTSITNKYAHTKTTHWADWQVADGVNINSGEIVSVASIGRDLRLLPELKKRPVEKAEDEKSDSDIYGALPNKSESTTP